jgi:hypothetical protein
LSFPKYELLFVSTSFPEHWGTFFDAGGTRKIFSEYKTFEWFEVVAVEGGGSMRVAV